MRRAVLLVSLAVVVLLAELAQLGSAAKFSTTSQTWRVTYSRVEFLGVFGVIQCAVTIEGSFHLRTSAKVASALTGFVTREAIGVPCIRGSATVLRETLPWHIQYEGFEGALPRITAIRSKVIGSAWRVNEPLGTTCLIRGTATEHVNARDVRNTLTGAITEVIMSGAIRTGPECLEVVGEVAGTSTSVTSGGGAAITVTLI